MFYCDLKVWLCCWRSLVFCNEVLACEDAIAENKEFIQQVKRRITELTNLVESLNDLAVIGLNELESLPSFDKNRDAAKFQQVALVVQALAEIMKTPVLDSEGQLNPATGTIQAKYRTLGGN